MASKIEQQVMASVGVIYAGRMVTGASAGKVYLTVFSGVALWQLTWVHSVVANFYEAAAGGGAVQFVTHVLTTANPLVLLVSLLFIFAGVSLVRDLARPASSPRLIAA